MTITVGIPSKGVNQSTLRVIELALSLEGVSEILVSVNPGIDSELLPSEIFSNSKIKVTLHDFDLGLYGNFRYLVQSATSDKFMWLCTDDAPSSNLLQLSDAIDDKGSILAIPKWYWSEYRPETSSFDPSRKLGVTPPNSRDDAYLSALMNPEPSWIFGLWNTRFLKRYMPVVDFDWLDVHLLQQALLSHKVICVDTTSPMIIGTWNWANKKPNSVKESGPYALTAVLYQLSLLPKFMGMGGVAFFSACRRARTLIQMAKQCREVRSK
jgi:hypothetical protein